MQIANSDESGGGDAEGAVLPDIDMVSLDPPDVQQYSALAADAWAAGMTLHCMLYGTLPFAFRGVGPMQIMRAISAFDPYACGSNDSAALEATHDDAGQTYVCVDYTERGDVVNDVWRKMLQCVPADKNDTNRVVQGRWGVAQALESEWIRSEIQRRTDTCQDIGAAGTSQT